MSKKNLKLNSKYTREEKEAAILAEVALDKTPDRIPVSRYNRLAKKFGINTMNKDELEDFEIDLNNQAKQLSQGPAYQVLYKVYNHELSLYDVVGTNENHREFQHEVHSGATTQVENHQMLLDVDRRLRRGKRGNVRIVNQINSALHYYDDSLKEMANIKHYEPKITKTVKKPKAMFIILSDMHVGCMVKDVDDRGSVNNYNISIAKHRWFTFINKALQIAKEQKVSKIILVNLGDEIENGAMRSNQYFTDQLAPSKQYTTMRNWFIKTLFMVSHYCQTDVINVMGNHSRIVPSFRDATWQDSWTWVLENDIKILSTGKHKLLHNVHVVNNTDNIRRAYYTLFGKHYCFIHGDVFNYKPKKFDNISRLESSSEPIDYLFAGHYHFYQDIALNGGKRQITCPSLEGHNTFSLKLGTPASNAAQLLVIASPKQTLLSIPVNLSDIQK